MKKSKIFVLCKDNARFGWIPAASPLFPWSGSVNTMSFPQIHPSLPSQSFHSYPVVPQTASLRVRNAWCSFGNGGNRGLDRPFLYIDGQGTGAVAGHSRRVPYGHYGVQQSTETPGSSVSGLSIKDPKRGKVRLLSWEAQKDSR